MTDPLARTDTSIEAIKKHLNADYKPEPPVFSGAPTELVEPISEILGVDYPTDAQREKMGFIAHELKITDPLELRSKVRELTRSLAQPRIGEDRVTILYNWLRAKQAVQHASNLKESYESTKR